MATSSNPDSDHSDLTEDYAGPVLWLNWRAQTEGHRARTVAREEGEFVFSPSWEEHSLFSDSSFSSATDEVHGPIDFCSDFRGRTVLPNKPSCFAPLTT